MCNSGKVASSFFLKRVMTALVVLFSLSGSASGMPKIGRVLLTGVIYRANLSGAISVSGAAKSVFLLVVPLGTASGISLVVSWVESGGWVVPWPVLIGGVGWTPFRCVVGGSGG